RQKPARPSALKSPSSVGYLPGLQLDLSCAAQSRAIGRIQFGIIQLQNGPTQATAQLGVRHGESASGQLLAAQLEFGHRLACRHRSGSDLAIQFPSEGHPVNLPKLE